MTKALSRSVGRPATKQRAIREYLHGKIVRGELAPGSRLLTRQELGEKFVASAMTVQQALNRLVADGFVVAKGKEGTFVSARPPHLCRYALVFPACPSDESWSRLYGALDGEAVHIQRSQARRMELFYGVDGHTDGEDYQKLMSEMRGQRLAGIIFASPPFKLRGLPLLEDRGTPRVAVMSHDMGALIPAVRAVSLDMELFIGRAMDYFASRGRKRVAALMLPQGDAVGLEARIVAAAEQRGLETHPYWCQSVARGSSRWARNCTHMLMRGGAGERPDALFITDDNLVEHATAGLVDAGVRVPDELDLVAHCNFPWPTPSVVPVCRLGFDAREVMRQCIELIDRQRRGEACPGDRFISPVFESELRPTAQGSGDGMLS